MDLQSGTLLGTINNGKKEDNEMTKRISRFGPFYGWDSNKVRVCKIDKVSIEQLAEFKSSDISGFQLDEWFVAFDSRNGLQFLGPFQSSQIACDHCVQKLGIEVISNDPGSDPNFTFGNE